MKVWACLGWLTPTVPWESLQRVSPLLELGEQLTHRSMGP